MTTSRRLAPWGIALALIAANGFEGLTRAGSNPNFHWRTPGDVDGDGISDLVLTGGVNWSSIPVAFSNADGSWRPTNASVASFATWAIQDGAMPVTGDFDGDGKMDIALTGGSGWGTIPVAFSSGNGAFRVTNYGASGFPAWASQAGVTAVAGDFNGDGLDDIALTGGPGWGTIPIAFSNGNGTFRITNTGVSGFPTWATQHSRPVAGDFNGDGRGDIALVGGPGWSTIPVAFSNGDGSFGVTNSWVANFPLYATQPGAVPVAGDFDGDGRGDIALTGGVGWGTIPLALSTGDGTFRVSNLEVAEFPSYAAQPGVKVVGGDFNGDGLGDVALVGGSGWTTVPIGFSNGDGTFRVTNAGTLDFPQYGAQSGAQALGALASPGRIAARLAGWCDPAPSAATCASIEYQQGTCASTTKTACASAITSQFTSTVHGASGNTTILEPHEMKPPTPSIDRFVDHSRYQAFDPSTMTGADPLGSFTTARSLALPPGPNLDPQHPDWEARGPAIASCKEYAYKRYYDYARFEEAAATCGGDDERIYSVAMSGTNPGLGFLLAMYDAVDRSSRRLLMFQTQNIPGQGKSPPPPGVPLSQPKNGFFGEDVAQMLSLLPSVAGDTEVQTIKNQIQAGMASAYVYDTSDRWAWHRQMHDSQVATYGAIPADERDATEKRLQNYKNLIAQVDAVEASLHGVYQTRHCTCTTMPCAQLIADAPPPPGWTCTPTATDGRLQNAIDDVVVALRAEWNHIDPRTGLIDHGCLDLQNTKCDWSPKQFGREYAGLLGGERAAAYQNCTAAFTPDDFAHVNDSNWPRKLFPADVADLHALEAAFGRARAAMDADAATWPWQSTAGANANTPGSRSTVALSFPQDGQRYGLRGFLEARWDYGGGWTTTVHKSSPTTIDYLDTEAKVYAYASFTLPRTSLPDPSDLAYVPTPGIADPRAQFSTAVDNAVDNLFAHTYTVVDGAFDATAGRNNGGLEVTGHLIFMGKQILAPFDYTVAANRNYEGPSFDDRVNVYNTTKPFTVFGIPCYVSLGVAANYGYTSGFDIEGYGTGTQSLANEKFHFQFLPRAKIDAVGSLGIGVPGLSVGVRGAVMVASLNLPFDVDTWFTGSGIDNLVLNIHTDAGIHARLLDGRISVFVDYLIDTAEAEVFSWHGIPLDQELWNRDFTMNMPQLRRQFEPRSL